MSPFTILFHLGDCDIIFFRRFIFESDLEVKPEAVRFLVVVFRTFADLELARVAYE